MTDRVISAAIGSKPGSIFMVCPLGIELRNFDITPAGQTAQPVAQGAGHA
jgi:hypothetical protein